MPIQTCVRVRVCVYTRNYSQVGVPAKLLQVTQRALGPKYQGRDPNDDSGFQCAPTSVSLSHTQIHTNKRPRL